MSLQTLIAPHDTAAFLSDYFEKAYLHVSRNDASYFQHLLDDLDLERQIWRYSSQWGDVSLAKAGTRAMDTPYAEGLPTIDAVADAFNNGYTVVVNNYQQKSASVAAFCRDVEKFFCFRCNVNLYLTAPRCKGLNAHYDDQDVFVMQLAGAKTWRVYEGGPLLPMEDQPYHCPDTAGLAFVELMLRPGDVLYLPRGYIHDACTEDSQSLHLTLSVSAVRRATLLKLLIKRLAARDECLRRSMPFSCLRGLAGNADLDDVMQIAGVFDRVGAADIQQALSDAQDRLLQVSSRLPGNQLRWASPKPSVTIESQVKIADDQLCMLSMVGGSYTLKFIGGQVPLSEDLLDTAGFIIEHRNFRVGDIDGGLSDAVNIAFVQFLSDAGLLVLTDQ
ncbi:JmjC domain-containing protein [Noviherbaspirillum aerium]|uniref:JmjC domain-containing protein n=1 Tax=Noviherbaspirillum aerium TaxID=2588497 RepID=UPI00124C2F11|nr:cupin domain-containing protein [Noviherbaspirillum aerium]